MDNSLYFVLMLSANYRVRLELLTWWSDWRKMLAKSVPVKDWDTVANHLCQIGVDNPEMKINSTDELFVWMNNYRSTWNVLILDSMDRETKNGVSRLVVQDISRLARGRVGLIFGSEEHAAFLYRELNR